MSDCLQCLLECTPHIVSATECGCMGRGGGHVRGVQAERQRERETERETERTREKARVGKERKGKRDPADSVRRQGCRHTCGDGTTGPSVSDCAENLESPAGAARGRMHVQIDDVPVPRGAQPVDQPGDQACLCSADSIHRQGCRYACGDAANGVSDADGVEDRGSPAGVVRRQSCGGACDHADAPVVPAPVPQILEEPIVLQFQVETVEVVQLSPQERISERTIEVDDVHTASATVLGKRKKNNKEGVVDVPTELFHDEDSKMTALMSRLKGEWLM